jgi:hypothetical protein
VSLGGHGRRRDRRRGRLSVRTQRVVVMIGLAILAVAGSQTDAGGAVAPLTVEITVSSAGVDANAPSRLDWVSSDGRYVLFDSGARNLVRHDTNGVRDVFLRDTVEARTIRVSVGPGGRQANGPSWGGSVSPSGSYVTFRSTATNLTRHADRNGVADGFLRAKKADGSWTTIRISVPPRGGQFTAAMSAPHRLGGLREMAPVLVSDDGRFVAFSVGRHGLKERAYLRDRTDRTTTRIGRIAAPISISSTGRFVVLQRLLADGSTWDVAVVDTAQHTTNSWRLAFTSQQVLGLPLTGLSTTPEATVIAISGPDTHVASHAGYWAPAGLDDWSVFSAPGSTNTYTAGISADARYVGASGSTGAYRIDLTTMSSIPVSVTAAGTTVRGRGLLAATAAWYVFPATGPGVTTTDTDKSADIFIRGPLPTP